MYVLNLQVPTPQNGQIHSNNSLNIYDGGFLFSQKGFLFLFSTWQGLENTLLNPCINPLIANSTNWSNVFDHFVGSDHLVKMLTITSILIFFELSLLRFSNCGKLSIKKKSHFSLLINVAQRKKLYFDFWYFLNPLSRV